MRIRIYPWKDPSESAKALRAAFKDLGQDALLLRREGSRYTPRDGDFIINWGSTDELPYPTINSSEAVQLATSKKATLTRLREEEVSCVGFTDDKDEATRVNADGRTVYARLQDRGSQGAGIIYVPSNHEGVFPDAKLYTYGEVGREYRIHTMIDGNGDSHTVKVQKRYKETDDCPIRSHNNGYRFITDGFQRPHHIRELAHDALRALGLQFGSVDIINAQVGDDRKLKVLEINTASGLEGSSSAELAQAFLDHLAPEPEELPEPEEGYIFDPDTEVKTVPQEGQAA